MFDLEKILVHESSVSRPIHDRVVVKNNYIDKMLENMSEYKDMNRANSKKFYEALSEVANIENEELFNKAFIDNYRESTEVILKGIKGIEEIYEEFVSDIKYLVEDTHIKNHLDTLNKFRDSNSFVIEGFNYNLSNNPKVTIKELFETVNLSKNKDLDLEDKINSYKEVTAELNNKSVIEQILESDHEIKDEYIIEEALNKYRMNGENTDLHISESDINTCLEEFSMESNLLESVRELKDNVCKTYRSIVETINNIAREFNDNDYKPFIESYIDSSITQKKAMDLTTESKSIINLANKERINCAVNNLDNYSLLFATKLEAVKECLETDRRILYTAISEMGGKDNKTLEVINTDEEDTFSKNLGEDEEKATIENVNIGEEFIEVTDSLGRNIKITNEMSALEIFDNEDIIIKAIEEGANEIEIADSDESDTFSEDLLEPANFNLTLSNIFEKDSNISMNHCIFLANEAYKDAELFNSIKTIRLLTEGTLTNESVIAIHENLVEGLKGLAAKIWNAIVTMWNKFVQSFDKLVKDNKSFLEKYKDIILKKQVTFGETIECWQYFDDEHGVKLALSPVLNDFRDRTVTDLKGLTVKADYIKAANDLLKAIHSGETIEDLNGFQSAILNQLKGTETTYNMKTIQENMTNIYDFCYNYTEYKTSNEKYLKEIENTTKKLEDILSKAAISVKESGVIQEFKVNKGDSTTNNTNSTTAYSLNTGTNNQNQTQNNTTDQSQTQNNNNTTNQTQNQGKLNGNTDGLSKEEIDNIKENVTQSLTFYSAILGAKLTFGQIAYKDYMKIMKAHVSTYTNPEKVNDAKTNADTRNNTDVKMAKPNK